jgi:hypothetical protein
MVTTGIGVYRADVLAAGLPATAWQRVSAGRGTKGHRYYDWSYTALPHATDSHGGHHWLLIRLRPVAPASSWVRATAGLWRRAGSFGAFFAVHMTISVPF